ncbi:hypothetical protein, partial [Bacteroides faecichinchillae]|uniref:hypothetical protein n=1 Tax=Bacteroides faecichinchillae TaxID=871325 RepID=UPI00145557F6
FSLSPASPEVFTRGVTVMMWGCPALVCMYRVSRDWAEVPPGYRDRTRNDRRVPNVRIFLIVRSVFIILRYFMLLFYTILILFLVLVLLLYTLVTGFLYQPSQKPQSHLAKPSAGIRYRHIRPSAYPIPVISPPGGRDTAAAVPCSSPSPNPGNSSLSAC